MAACKRRVGYVVTSLALAATTLLMPAISFSQSTKTIAHSDSALLRLIAIASEKNRLPPDLISYKAKVETEVDLLVRHGQGTESVASIEQLASSLRWTRAGVNDQHVEGYRSQTGGLSMAMIALPTGWINPVLYGNRLRTLGKAQTVDASDTISGSIAQRRRAQRIAEEKKNSHGTPDTLAVIHPLAVDRERYYEYTRGDTLVTLHSGDRRIPIVRVHVEPRANLRDSVAVFVGDIDLDVSRGTLVRMRGYFTRAGVARQRGILLSLIDALGFIEFENAEYEGKYWLPSTQRIELQVMSPMFGDARGVIRIVSRFPNIAVNDSTLDSLTMLRADSLRTLAHRKLIYASGDSLAKYSTWEYSLGAIATGLHADDFNDIAPDRMRPTGAPRLDLSASRSSDVIRFNRVEGLYTGLGVKLSMRDLAPGVVARVNAGWAWSEQTARARVEVARTAGPVTLSARVGRSLDITNDFRSPTDSGSSTNALGTDDSYDYVDRRSAAIGISRNFLSRNLNVRVEVGVADDRYAAATVKRGLWGKGTFPPNRGVDAGSYRLTSLIAEWHPSVDAVIIRPSLSSRLLYERGDGTLNYQRVEFRTIAVQLFGPFTWTMRGDVGQVFGARIPSQQLFELGRGQNLPSYGNKEFAGSRAAILRTTFMYRSPWLSQRIHIARSYWLPSISPGASIGVQSGWADAPTAAGVESVLRLGMLPDSNGVLQPVSKVTGNPRASASVGLRFFSGNVFIGFTRPLDHVEPWTFRIGGGF